jgi:hypothetical protein
MEGARRVRAPRLPITGNAHAAHLIIDSPPFSY